MCRRMRDDDVALARQFKVVLAAPFGGEAVGGVTMAGMPAIIAGGEALAALLLLTRSHRPVRTKAATSFEEATRSGATGPSSMTENTPPSNRDDVMGCCGCRKATVASRVRPLPIGAATCRPDSTAAAAASGPSAPAASSGVIERLYVLSLRTGGRSVGGGGGAHG